MSATPHVRVLVVDDDPLQCEIVGARLHQDGYFVAAAGDGVQAIEYLDNNPVDLVIADLEMPHMNGFELIRNLRQRPEMAHLPVIVVTGVRDAWACEQAYQAGATSFITKPVNWTLLSNEVAYVLRNAAHELELSLAKQQLESALRVKNHILAVISHELRTPLHSVTGFARLIVDEVNGPVGDASYLEYANEIEQAGRSLNLRIGDMLLLAQLPSEGLTLDADDYSAEEILMSVRGTYLTTLLRPKPVINIVLEDADLVIRCNAQLVMAAIRHLIENAVKFGGNEVSIEIGTRSVEDAVVLYVEDNGPGMPEAVDQWCIEPFRQAEMSLGRSKEGLGLGLTIARAVA